MEELKFTFLVATRNRREALKECLSSIEAQSYSNREIVVVDDGSEDGTQELLNECFPNVVSVRNPQRRGIGLSLSRGAELATGDILVDLDDDAFLPEDSALAEMARLFAENPDFDVICFRCVAPDGSVRHREIPSRTKKMPPGGSQIAYFLGGAVAFRGSALRDVGGYPEDIQYGSWENSVAFRLFKAGHKIMWGPSVCVVHRAIPSPYNTHEREANYIRSEVHLAGRYLPFPYAHVHALLWIVLYGMLAILRGHPGPALRTVWTGVREWGTLRKDKDERLSLAETHRLSALGGRTWY